MDNNDNACSSDSRIGEGDSLRKEDEVNLQSCLIGQAGDLAQPRLPLRSPDGTVAVLHCCWKCSEGKQ